MGSIYMSQITEKQTMRALTNIFQGQLGSDGDGVKLTRLIGNQDLNMLDPFLLLDLFESDQPNDYIGGSFVMNTKAEVMQAFSEQVKPFLIIFIKIQVTFTTIKTLYVTPLDWIHIRMRAPLIIINTKVIM